MPLASHNSETTRRKNAGSGLEAMVDPEGPLLFYPDYQVAECSQRNHDELLVPVSLSSSAGPWLRGACCRPCQARILRSILCPAGLLRAEFGTLGQKTRTD